jgi:uncharacterized protein YndB with AHSA1/START domain
VSSTDTTQTAQAVETTQMFCVYIKATPQAVWDAITSPEWSEKYGYRGRTEYELRPGGSYKAFATEDMKAFGAPDVVVDGEVVEVEAPTRLVQTYRMLFSPELEAEGFTRVTWELREEQPGLTRLLVTHECEGAPNHAGAVRGLRPLAEGGGGWPLVLSDLKSLLETGEAFDA